MLKLCSLLNFEVNKCQGNAGIHNAFGEYVDPIRVHLYTLV
jgi:hypothetical protein